MIQLNVKIQNHTNITKMTRAGDAHNIASSSGLDYASSPDIIARMTEYGKEYFLFY